MSFDPTQTKKGKKNKEASEDPIESDAEGGKGSSGKGKGKQKTNKYQLDLKAVSRAMPVVVKATLSSLQANREIESVLYDVALTATNTEIPASMKKFTTEWNKKVKESGSGHGLGPPHLAAWEGFLVALMAGDIGASNKVVINQILEAYKTATPEQAGLDVRLCRCKKTFNPEKVRIIISVRGSLEQHRHTLRESLKQLGAELKSGRAPPSGLERSLQEMLEEWKIE